MPPKNKGRIKVKVKHNRAKCYKTEEQVRYEEELKTKDVKWKQRNLEMPSSESSDSEPAAEHPETDKIENKEKETELQPGNDGANFIPGLDDDDDESGSMDDERTIKAKGVAHLIEISNPNRVDRNITKKIEDIGDVQLTRREKESMDAERAKARMDKDRAAGRTAEAKRDLARLDQIRKEREEAARKKELERKAKEERNQQKLATIKPQPM